MKINWKLVKVMIEKYFHDQIWGEKHHRTDTLLRGFPPHFRGDVKKYLKFLRKKGILVRSKTFHGGQWHLNRYKLEIIKEVAHPNTKIERVRKLILSE